MSDAIHLQGMRVWGKHGANPGERDNPQPFDIELELAVDLQAAQASDNLADTVNYAVVNDHVVKIVTTHSYQLLERLAGVILEILFLDSRVVAGRVTIAKPAVLDGATPSVTLSRRNPRI